MPALQGSIPNQIGLRSYERPVSELRPTHRATTPSSESISDYL
jgi:hypothetical protein